MAPRKKRAPSPKTANTIVRRARRRSGRRKKSSSKTPVSYNHRTHPAKLTRPPPGYCRWCVSPILRADGELNRRKSWCSQACVGHYLLRADPKVMRQHVFFRDDGRCDRCKKQWKYMSDPWDADHMQPLFLAFGDASFWEPDNVVILCRDPCHKNKTAEDQRKYGFVTKLCK